jgi:O-succinylbenzoate synthase
VNIERAELIHLSMPLVSSFKTSFGVEKQRDCILVKLYSEGLVGVGECVASQLPGYSYETVWTAWEMMARFFIPRLLELSAVEVNSFRDGIQEFKGFPMARAGIEMALWDLAGKRTQSSLRDLLAGQIGSVAVGVSVGIQPSPEALVETVGRYVDAGYQRVKLKIEPGRDVAEVRAVRDAYPKLALQVDANSAYTLSQSQPILALDEYELLLIEQPLAEDDLIDHSQLQKKLQTPICLDESILSLEHTRKALEIDAGRIINIKAGRVGGLTEAVAIHNLCYARGVPVWCGGMLETGVGRAANLALASLPGFSLPGDISATDRYYQTDITQEQFQLNKNSTIDVPVGPGLGIRLDEERVEMFRQRSAAFP